MRNLRKIAEAIRAGQTFLISSHTNPEGDAIGSVLALSLGLKSLGKEVQVLNQDPVPEMLMFLPGVEDVTHQVIASRRFDVSFALDCGDPERLGNALPGIKQADKIINIDHHTGNSHFGDLNLIDPAASSTAEIIYDLLRAIPIEFTKPIAENIYTGILTDTGSFRYSNTSVKAFRIAQSCLVAGVDPRELAQKIYETQPLARLRLLRLALGTLEVTAEGRIGSMTVSRKMIEESGASVDLTEDFINYPRSLKGIEVAVLFREISSEEYRVSFRSRGRVNVAEIAREFRGGGHPNAAGCTVAGSLASAKARVLAALRAVF
jgi:phosphoesterase RecJ-like protein